MFGNNPVCPGWNEKLLLCLGDAIDLVLEDLLGGLLAGNLDIVVVLDVVKPGLVGDLVVGLLALELQERKLVLFLVVVMRLLLEVLLVIIEPLDLGVCISQQTLQPVFHPLGLLVFVVD